MSGKHDVSLPFEGPFDKIKLGSVKSLSEQAYKLGLYFLKLRITWANTIFLEKEIMFLLFYI
jgi:hypothetical protein